ncbi:MAG: hypothetical protein AB7S26_00540 [Sandaracinaceae bacterium]
MTRSRLLLAVLASVLAMGCARNAIFELELDLPPGGAARFVRVTASESLSFSDDWSDVPELVELGPLPPSCARPDPSPVCEERAEIDADCGAIISVVSGSSSQGILRLRARFCASQGCTSPADASAPEARITVERAFYQGRYTDARVCFDETPAADVDVTIARCDVRCREGTAAMWCRADGTHFCEDPR